jgi:NADPH-dependent 2,4-dienoyl-CoA reductase/sulfur reductase-like enzyme/nitrite reductase/ring-hydroxylating ferredoxin subunit
MASPPDSRIDLSAGIAVTGVPDGGSVSGRVGTDDVLLVRSGNSMFAVAPLCSHYSAPLADGLVVGETVRCPRHHACFSLRSGEALRAPALDPLACWRVERVGDVAFVRERIQGSIHSERFQPAPGAGPESVLIIGGGAAGLAAAEMLRRVGYERPVTILSADDSAPCDRPNLSKDYLAGTAAEEWIPLRPQEFYTERRIDLLLNARVDAIDVEHRSVRLSDGREFAYGALLVATGADPIRLQIDGAASTQLHYLRSFADSRAIIAKLGSARHAIVVGASFIGLEVAASLRERGLDVHVVGLEKIPMERVLGPELGRFVQALHEAHGVTFHLGASITRVDGETAILSDGTRLPAEIVIIGAGVRPALSLAERAGLALDRGVVVDQYLETSAPGIFAAGDIVRWPDPHSGARIRVEHWVVAESQGQAAALNMLGARQPFDAVPFFWSQHYDVAINYAGHAEAWDAIEIDGSLEAQDATVRYQLAGRTVAVVTIGRDRESLSAELRMGQIGN